MRRSLALLLVSSACNSQPGARSDPVPSATSSASGRPATERLQPRARWLPSREFRVVDEAGARGAVVGGRRVLLRSVGASFAETVVDAAPIAGLGLPYRVPDVLGGGYLFVSRLAVHSAPSFDGKLTLIATNPEPHFDPWPQSQVGIGYDSVLVTFNGAPSVLYDLRSGERVKPFRADVKELYGTPEGLVAARAGRKLFIKHERQSPWRALTSPPVESLGYDGRGIRVGLADRALRLSFDGKLKPISEGEAGVLLGNNLDVSTYQELLDGAPDRDVDRIFGGAAQPMTPDTLITIDGTRLVFLDALSGAVKRTLPDAFGALDGCGVLRGGLPAFIGCNDPERTLLRVPAEGSAPVIEPGFHGRDRFDIEPQNPDGPLTFQMRCDGTPDKSSFCLRRAENDWRELSLAESDRALADAVSWINVTSTKDGSVYALGWLQAELVLADVKRSKLRRLHPPEPAHEAFIGWDSLTYEGATLRSMIGSKVTSAAIIEVLPDDTVRWKPLTGEFSPAGPFALQRTPEGKLLETIDGGHSFHEVTAPPGGLGAASAEEGVFCIVTGCAVGAWYRVGWSQLGAAAR